MFELGPILGILGGHGGKRHYKKLFPSSRGTTFVNIILVVMGEQCYCLRQLPPKGVTSGHGQYGVNTILSLVIHSDERGRVGTQLCTLTITSIRYTCALVRRPC